MSARLAKHIRIGSFVEFDTWHSSGEHFVKRRDGIVLDICTRGSDFYYVISDGRETFNFVYQNDIKKILSK